MKPADCSSTTPTIGRQVAGASSWHAGLCLDFFQANEKTVLRQTKHHGPLQTQRAFYPEGESVCHTYILHPPGGVVGGDMLDMKITVHPFAKALVTTPAAGKYYRSSGPQSTLNQTMTVAKGGVLEWLPQENIVYNKAQACQTTTVELAEDANFLGWEVSCLGLEASEDWFVDGTFKQSFDIRQNGVPLFIERSVFETGSAVFDAPWGLRKFSVTGTLLCSCSDDGQIDSILTAIREATAFSEQEELFSVTSVSGMIVCRYLGRHVYRAKKHFLAAWSILRKVVLGRRTCLPRIWNT